MAKKIMQKESKQNLITLSLAGAIGHYLYSKLMSFQGLETNYLDPIEEKNDVIEPVEQEILDSSVVDKLAEIDDIEESVQPDESTVVDESDVVQNNDTPEVAITIACPYCEYMNAEDAKTCSACGAYLAVTNNEVDNNEVNQDALAPDVTEVIVDTPEEPVAEEPIDDGDDDVDLDVSEEDEDVTVDSLFESVQEDEPKLMGNIEPLHKVDHKDNSAKQEFKSIMDFFDTI